MIIEALDYGVLTCCYLEMCTVPVFEQSMQQHLPGCALGGDNQRFIRDPRDSRLTQVDCSLFFPAPFPRLSENPVETPRKLHRILAGGEEVPLLDPAHGEDTVVLLVRDSPCLSEHSLCGRRALRPALLPHGVSV